MRSRVARQHVGVMSLDVFEDTLISGCDDSVIRVWNTNSWTCEKLLRAHKVIPMKHSREDRAPSLILAPCIEWCAGRGVESAGDA